MKNLSRRSLLRGAGATMALPWLEAMGAPATSPARAAFIYIPNGVLQAAWRPRQTGALSELPHSLEPLAKVRDRVLVLSGLDRTYVSGTGVHAQCGSCWLTSSPPTEALDGGFPTNTSLDQILARKVGQQTLFASLELSCNDHTDNKETRYFESISWIAPGYAANIERNPRAVYQRMFGDLNADPTYRSMLDAVKEGGKALRSTLGKADQVRLDEYLESVRSIERRIELAEKAAARRAQPPIPEPAGIPETRGAYIRLMFDLMIIAFQQDITRVATVVIDPERWDSPRTYHGLFDKPEDHHQLTHTKGDEPKLKIAKIDRFHVEQYAYLIERMSEIREGERTLLDSSAIVLGSGLGDGSIHSYKDLPLLMAGSAGGRFKLGQHVAFPTGTPLSNFWLSLLNAFGAGQARFADSTRRLQELDA